MKTLLRCALVLAVLVSLGCETTHGGGSAPAKSSGGSAASSSSGGKMLTDSDYKRLGIRETYEDR